MNRRLPGLLLLLASLPAVLGTHFAFGTISFSKTERTNDQSTSVTIFAEFAWRWSYSSFNNGNPISEGDIFTVGEICFSPDQNGAAEAGRPLQTSTSPNFPSGIGPTCRGTGQRRVQMNEHQVDYVWKDPNAGNNDRTSYFQGFWISEQNLAAGYWWVSFGNCCRLSSLLNSANDKSFIVHARINVQTRDVGATTAGLYRTYAELNAPWYFNIPVSWGQDAAGITFEPDVNDPAAGNIIFKLPPTLASALPKPRLHNSGTNQPVVGYDTSECRSYSTSCVTMNPRDGSMVWTPNTAGLYAMQVQIHDEPIPITSSMITPIDFIIVVIQDCNPNCAPYFIPRRPEGHDPCDPEYCTACHTTLGACYEVGKPQQACNAATVDANCRTKVEQAWFYKNIESFFYIVSTDDDAGDITDVSKSAHPLTAIWTLENRAGPTTWYKMTWTPGLSDVSKDVAFQAFDNQNPPMRSFNSYNVKMDIREGDILYVSGILRDFLSTHADFAITAATAPHSQAVFVQNGASNDGRPVYKPGVAGAPSAATFAQWFVTDPAWNKDTVFSRTLTDVGDDGTFTWSTTNFFPIDDLLLKNEGQAHNYYFTYEVHTYVTYDASVTDLSLEFFTVDDLFIFIDYKLAVSMPGPAPPGGQSFVLDWAAFGVANNLAQDTTYRCDIFYAHRSAGTTPGITLTLPANSLCNALTPLGSYIEFDYVFGTTPQNQVRLKYDTRVSNFGTTSFEIMLANKPSTSSAVWFADVAKVTSAKVKVLQGFQADFTFRVAAGNQPEGFAFVMQSEAHNAQGNPATGLGYASMKRALVIEFDMNGDSGDGGDYQGVQHVAVVRSSAIDFTQGISSAHDDADTVAMSNPLDPIFTMNNATDHKVVITYTPPQEETYREGWLRVWMNTILAPVVEARMDSVELREIFGGAAYVGFTSGSGTGASSPAIQIRDWKMTIVTISAPLTDTLTTYASVTAGQTWAMAIQARDSCGVAITVGSDDEVPRFEAVLRRKLRSGFTAQLGPEVATGTISSRGDGIYDATFLAGSAGPMLLAITFDGVPIKGSPFTIDVAAGITDPAHTHIVAGQLPVLRDNTLFNGNAIGSAIQVGVFNQYGQLVAMEAFTDTTVANNAGYNLAAFLTLHQGESLAMAVKNAVPSFASFSHAALAGCDSYVNEGSWTCIKSSCGTASASDLGWVSAITVDCTDFQLVAQSGNYNAGPTYIYGYVNAVQTSEPWEFRANDGLNSEFGIIAMDSFDNLQTSLGDNFAVSFSPNVDHVTQARTAHRAYHVVNWDTTVSGLYDLYVAIRSFQVNSSPKPVKVLSGLPHHITSRVAGGAAAFGVAGTEGQFTLILLDEFGNTVNNDPFAPIPYVTGRLDGTGAGENGADLAHVNLQFTFNENTNEATATYLTTKSAVYGLKMFVGPPGGQLEEWDYTLGSDTTIVAADLSPAHSVITTANGDPMPTTVLAGVTQQFIIQARDQYENKRLVPNVAGDGPFVATFTTVDTGTHRDDLVAYEGDGAYAFEYVGRNQGLLDMQVKAANAIISTSGTATPVQASTGFRITVNHGFPAGASILSTAITPVAAGVQSTVRFLGIDSEGNQCTSNQAQFLDRIVATMNGADTIASLGVAIPAYGGAACGGQPAHCYTITWSAAVATTYDVAVAASGAEVVGSPIQVTVTPGPPDCAVSAFDEVNGERGFAGGVSGDTARFDVIVRDQYGNRVLFADHDASVGTTLDYDMSSTTGTFTASVTSVSRSVGTFDFLSIRVSYTVPDPDTYSVDLTSVGNVWRENKICRVLSIQSYGAAPQYYVAMDANTATTIYNDLGASYQLTPAVAKQAYEFCFHPFDDSSFSTPVAGTPTSYAVNVVCNDPNTCGTAQLAAVVESAPRADHQWCGTVTVTKAGSYQLEVYANNFAQSFVKTDTPSSQAIALQVNPGPIHAPSCDIGRVWAAGFPQPTLNKNDAVAGVQFDFPVVLKDEGFNVILSNERASLTGTMTLSGACSPNCETVPISFIAHVDGMYVGSTMATTAGTYTLVVEHSGTALGSPSQYTVRVGPGPPYASQTVLSADVSSDNLANNIVQVPASPVMQSFFLTVRDQFGNVVPDGSLTFSTNPTTLLDATSFTYSSKGKWAVSMQSQISDNYPVQITIDGHVDTFDAEVHVMPQFPTTAIFTPPVFTSPAGSDAVFTVEFQDEYGNAWVDSSRGFFAVASDPNGLTQKANVTQSGPENLSPPFTGLFTVTLGAASTEKAGMYSWSWSIDGRAVPLDAAVSPFTFSITAGAIHAGPTILLSQWDNGKVGIALTAKIQLTDVFGNALANGDDFDLISVEFLRAAITDCTTTETIAGTEEIYYADLPQAAAGDLNYTLSNNGDGTVDIMLTPYKKSPPAFSMLVYHDKAGASSLLDCVTAQRASLFVNPGNPHGPTSQIDGLEANYTAGDEFTVIVTLRDYLSNTLSVGGDKDLITFADPTGACDAEQIVDRLDGSYLAVLTCTKAGIINFDYAVGTSGRIPVATNMADQMTVTILTGPPAAFNVQWPDENGSSKIAGEVSTVSLNPTDRFGNTLEDTDDISFELILTQRFQGSQTVKYQIRAVDITNAAVSPAVDFQTSFTTVWDGEFEFLVLMFDGGSLVASQNGTYTFDGATCASREPGTLFQCASSGDCVAAWSECPNPTCSHPRNQCPGAGCAATCDCPAATSFRCPAGNCALDALACGTPDVCAADAETCPTGECRAALVDCPSTLECPPDYFACPSGVQCALTASECPVIDPNACSAVQCPSGACVSSLNDCPTPKTCPTERPALCPDGSCQVSGQCPSLFPCAAGETRCADGTCRSDAAACPTPPTCPSGSPVLCESGHCAPALADCDEPTRCTADMVRCPDGSCAANPSLCPTTQSCPPDAPVLCPDRACRETVSLCSTLQTCTIGLATTTCPDGSCVADGTPCPTGRRCPDHLPVLCQDGSCKQVNTECVVFESCLPGKTKCPSGFCANNLYDCPSGLACSGEQPLKCPDGQCASSLSACVDPAELDCMSGVKCPGGECAPALSLCPTHITCPATHTRCIDGTCRQDCSNIITLPCEPPFVTCPNAGMGIMCAISLADCPTSPICPADKTVRCLDNTCAATVTSCPPPPPDSTYDDKYVCPGGYFAEIDDSGNSNTTCPTMVTCPAEAPFKCLDETCRKISSDCPDPQPCSAQNPYRCLNGACVVSLVDSSCSSNDAPCPGDATVRCPVGVNCVSSVSECGDPFDGTFEPCTSRNFFHCSDGICVQEEDMCVAPACPSALPNQCPDGACVEEVDDWATTLCYDPLTGCLPSENKCAESGSCVEITPGQADDTNCPDAEPCTGGQTRCSDGSCNEAAFCPAKNGCERQEFRCYDGTCVEQLEDCTSPTSGANACPPSLPFRCTSGFCSVSEVLCPVIAFVCPAGTVPCASGECKTSSNKCPIVQPCDSTQYRCNDGMCHETLFVGADGANCPTYNSCAATGLPWKCDSGLCASEESQCVDPKTGCPVSWTKCWNGECKASASYCSLETAPPSGCTNITHVKCWNGACATALDQCVKRNGCPAATPLRCPLDQDCVADIATCDNSCASTDANLKCADGTCPTDLATCPATSGCPAGKPVRCADGTCAAFSAVTAIDTTDKCGIVINTCLNGYSLCVDGACVLDGSLYCHPSTNAVPLDPTKCPASRPVHCSDGACVNSVQECSDFVVGSITTIPGTGVAGTGGSNGNATTTITLQNQDQIYPNSACKPGFTRCMDGACRQGSEACIRFVDMLAGQPASATLGASCESPKVFCSNGECVDHWRRCPITEACRMFETRCEDGTCVAPGTSCPTLAKCGSGQTRCEDGLCRSKCHYFDGCPNTRPFHCQNRECGKDENDCDASLRWKYTGTARISRRLLSPAEEEEQEPARPCYTNCNAQINAVSLNFSVSTFSPVSVPIAFDVLNVPVAEIKIPAGALRADASGNNTLHTFTVGPVADSRVRDAQNSLHPTRYEDFNNARDLSYPQTLLSTSFECWVGDGTASNFSVPVTYAATIDFSARPIRSDVCFAFLFKIESLSYARWQCLERDSEKRKVNVPSISSLQQHLVEGVFSECGKHVDKGMVYGFIHAPLVKTVPPTVTVTDWWLDNLPWIILVILSVVLVMVGALYFMKRLHRYRGKYKQERKIVDKLQDEVEEMEQYGGTVGRKDDEVVYVQNPLSVQIDQLRKQDETVQQELIEDTDKTKAEVAELQEQSEDLKKQLALLLEQLAANNDADDVVERVEDERPQRTDDTHVSQPQPTATFGGGGQRGGRRRKDLD